MSTEPEMNWEKWNALKGIPSREPEGPSVDTEKMWLRRLVDDLYAIIANHKEALKVANDEIEDWRKRHRALSKRYADLRKAAPYIEDGGRN